MLVKFVTVFLFWFILISDSNFTLQNSFQLSDWASNLYGQPICVEIPRKMELCQNINYSKMKLPNLLGHGTINEVVQQSSAWNPLIGINCHKDTQLFLCSLFAPVCIEQATSAKIYPCRSLCEKVKNSCETPMLSYNYPWPSMFNCSQFPEDNGFCIKSSDKMGHSEPINVKITELITTTLRTAIKIRPKSEQKIKIRPKSEQKVKINEHNKVEKTNKFCHSCEKMEKNFNMENVVKSYCNSRIALRGRVSSYTPSQFSLNLKRRRYINENQLLSKHILIPRRDRRFFKGRRILYATIGTFLTEENLKNYFLNTLNQKRFDRKEDLDFYILSDDLLKSIRMSRNRMKLRRKVRKSLRKDTRGIFDSNKYCKCPILEKNSFRNRYFITANVLTVRKNFVKQNLPHLNLSQSSSSVNNYLYRNTRRASQSSKPFLKYNFKMIHVTGLYHYNRVRPFIDYLDNFNLDKGGMCQNIQRTVEEIRRADHMFF